MTKLLIPPAVDPIQFREVEKLRKYWVQGINGDDYEHIMFDMKFEVGEKYLESLSIPPEEKYRLKRSKAFWVWLNQIWYLNDLRLFKKNRNVHLSLSMYQGLQMIRIKAYKVNRAAMQAALEEKAAAKE